MKYLYYRAAATEVDHLLALSDSSKTGRNFAIYLSQETPWIIEDRHGTFHVINPDHIIEAYICEQDEGES